MSPTYSSNRVHTVYRTLYDLMLTDSPTFVPGSAIFAATCSVLFHETEWPAFSTEAHNLRFFGIYGIDSALHRMQLEYAAWCHFRAIEAGLPQLALPLPPSAKETT